MIYRDVTLQYLKETTHQYRKRAGQIFTPRPLREKLYSMIPSERFVKILEPSCGTGEFLFDFLEKHPGVDITGVEADPVLASTLQFLKAPVTQGDFLRFSGKFDLIIGNPPFIWSPKVIRRYSDIGGGKLNLCSLFVRHSIELLRTGGILAFVLPLSFSNGRYFSGIRKVLTQRGEVLGVSFERARNIFLNVDQPVMLLVWRKTDKVKSRKFVFSKRLGSREFCFITEHAELIEESLRKYNTLFDLGFRVKTGQLAWNRFKPYLRDDGGIPLIWSSNISDRIIESSRPKFVDEFVLKSHTPFSSPAIVTNRIVGLGGKIKAAITEYPKFFAENHVNVVLPPLNFSDLDEIAGKLRRAAEYVTRISGGTQISSLELLHFIPVMEK